MSAKILLIETSTEACSVALSDNGNIISHKYILEPKSHAKVIAPFIDDILKEKNLKTDNLSAVAISEGPGSYTGLRVGTSIAKGICYGSNIPLIAIGTLDILADQTIIHIGPSIGEKVVIIPMLDARRMEVYCAVYDNMGKNIEQVRPHILSENSFEEYYSKSEIIISGDGAEKFYQILPENKKRQTTLLPTYPDARYMAKRAQLAWDNNIFKDVAYFEPFYLKEFQATTKSTK